MSTSSNSVPWWGWLIAITVLVAGTVVLIVWLANSHNSSGPSGPPVTFKSRAAPGALIPFGTSLGDTGPSGSTGVCGSPTFSINQCAYNDTTYGPYAFPTAADTTDIGRALSAAVTKVYNN